MCGWCRALERELGEGADAFAPAVGAVEVHAFAEIGLGAETDARSEIPEEVDGSVKAVFVVACVGDAVARKIAALAESSRHEHFGCEIVLKACEIAPAGDGGESAGLSGIGHEVIFAQEEVAAEVRVGTSAVDGRIDCQRIDGAEYGAQLYAPADFLMVA